MTKGKAICNALKQLRVAIAEANQIEYHPAECTHAGDCSGTCSKCDEELEYLTREIRGKGVMNKRRNMHLDHLRSPQEDLVQQEEQLCGIIGPEEVWESENFGV